VIVSRLYLFFDLVAFEVYKAVKIYFVYSCFMTSPRPRVIYQSL